MASFCWNKPLSGPRRRAPRPDRGACGKAVHLRCTQQQAVLFFSLRREREREIARVREVEIFHVCVYVIQYNIFIVIWYMKWYDIMYFIIFVSIWIFDTHFEFLLHFHFHLIFLFQCLHRLDIIILVYYIYHLNQLIYLSTSIYPSIYLSIY